jgi:hypothetical protein
MKTQQSAAKRRTPLMEAPLRSGTESFAALPACALILSFSFFSPPPPNPLSTCVTSCASSFNGTADQHPPCAVFYSLTVAARCPLVRSPYTRSAAFAWANLRFDGVFALRPQARLRMCLFIGPCTMWPLSCLWTAQGQK